VAEIMAAIMGLRLPLDVRLVAVLPAAGLTMLVCERRIEGTGPDGKPVRMCGIGCTVVRAQPDGAWRIAADAWCLADEPPTVPL
jgi:ketosteroid isomerase-like protein